jgi:cytidyltransferase-like protein
MKTFKMFLEQEEQNNNTTETCVIYGGRFQPMHPGHFEVVKSLEKTFGGSSVVIATSNRVEDDPNAKDYSPFNFDEKRKIIETLFHPECPITMCKNPTFSPTEITSHMNRDAAVILVVSEKDQERYGNKSEWYLPLPENYKAGDSLLSFPKTGKSYYYVISMKEDGLSATSVRAGIGQENENKARSYFKRIYKSDNKNIFDLMRSKLIGIHQEA